MDAVAQEFGRNDRVLAVPVEELSIQVFTPYFIKAMDTLREDKAVFVRCPHLIAQLFKKLSCASFVSELRKFWFCVTRKYLELYNSAFEGFKLGGKQSNVITRARTSIAR